VQEKRGQWVRGRVTRALTGTSSATGQPYDIYEEGAALVTGLRPMQARLPETFSYKGFEYNQALRDATSVFAQAANANDTTEQDVIEAYQRANSQLMRGQAQLYDLVETARRLGMSERQIRQQLIDVAQLGRKQTNRIMRGQFDPLGISDERVKAVLREGRTQARTIKRLPTRELKSIERGLNRQELIPQDFRGTAEQPAANGALFGEPATGPMFGEPVTQRAAPAAPVIGSMPAPATPQPSPAPARNAPPNPALLGSDPISQARNAEIAQRLSGQ
jgi:hypothetical protein